MVRLLIEERYTWPVRAVLLGGGGLLATSYQIFFRASVKEDLHTTLKGSSVSLSCWKKVSSSYCSEPLIWLRNSTIW